MKYQARNSEFHLQPRELRALVEAASSIRDRLIAMLLVYTALRRAEIRELRRSDIDFERSRVVVRRGKGAKQRLLFLPTELASEMHTYVARFRGDYVFPGRKGGPMSLRNINYIVARLALHAGVATPNPRYRNVGPHLIRHSFARHWKRTGGSIETLRRVLGHSSVKTTLDLYGNESQTEAEANYRETVVEMYSPRD